MAPEGLGLPRIASDCLGLPRIASDVFEFACYVWQASELDDRISDEALIHALKARLEYVHTSAAQALAACVHEPNVAKKPGHFGEHGVDVAVLKAFAAQLLYYLTDARAAALLTSASGKARVPIVSVPRFLALFEGGSDGGRRGAQSSRLDEGRIQPVSGVEKLTAREQKLLLTMRDYLFEQHAQMKNMFRRCDPDNNGYVSIEEFLNAMSRAGVPMGHGLDRQAATISEEEAARIVGFFDKEGDGRLRYHEFMTMLQSTKNSVLTKRVLQPSRP